MILSVQYLRFFACLIVVTLHLTLKVAINDGGGYLSFGASGVDLFFVTSGFIMCYISERREYNPVTFLKKRFMRIYPIYWVTLIPFVIIFLLAPQMVNSHGETPSILKSITLLPFLNGGYVNMVAWTLSYELYFYLIYSIALLMHKDAIIISTILILSMIIIGKVFGITFIDSMISVEFIFGMLIFKLIYKKKIGKKIAYPLIVFCFSWICVSSKIEFGGNDTSRVLYYGIPSAMIFVGFLSEGLFRRKYNTLALLGDASYSTYLTHILTINAVYISFKIIGLQEKMYYPMVIIGVLMSFFIGVLVHKRVEIPLRNKIKLLSFFIKKSHSDNT